MSIWNKILLGFIFVAAVAFFYLAMRTLKTHQHWRELVHRLEKKIEATEQENREFVKGAGEDENYQPGIERLQLDLHKMLIDRGRVWTNCTPKADAETGQVKVTTDLPDPHGIAGQDEQAVLYAFEGRLDEEQDAAANWQYIGAFKVAGVAEESVDLEPAMKMEKGSREFERLVASKGPWILYEIMPNDSHEMFADLEEEELRALLPEASLAEYLKDGQQATADDLVSWGIKGKVVDENGGEVQGAAKGSYVRQLRDYEVFFQAYHQQRTILMDLIASAERDHQYTEDAVADAQRQIQLGETEKNRLNAELAESRRQRDVVIEHLAKLRSKLAAIQAAIVEKIANNMATAGQIAKIQLDAARQIDARTRNMARNNAGGS